MPLSATPRKWLLVVNPREAAVGQTLSLEGKPLGNLEPRSSKTQACPGPLCGLSWHSPHFLKVGNWASEDLSPLSSWISPRSLGGGRQRGRRRRGCHSLVEPDVLKMRGTRLPISRRKPGLFTVLHHPHAALLPQHLVGRRCSHQAGATRTEAERGGQATPQAPLGMSVPCQHNTEGSDTVGNQPWGEPRRPIWSGPPERMAGPDLAPGGSAQGTVSPRLQAPGLWGDQVSGGHLWEPSSVYLSSLCPILGYPGAIVQALQAQILLEPEFRLNLKMLFEPQGWGLQLPSLGRGRVGLALRESFPRDWSVTG